MNTTLKRVGIAALTTATIALAGCETTNGGSTSNPPPVSPRDALIASTTAMKTNSYDITTSDSTGSVDPGAHSMALTSTDPENPGDLVLTSDSVYLKLDLGDNAQGLGVDPDKFFVISRSLIPASNAIGKMAVADGDVFFLSELLSQGLVDATRTGNDFAGHLDLTKLTGFYKLPESELTTVGDKAKAVPVTASVDDQGRLVAIKVDDSAIKDDLLGDDIITVVGLDIKIANYGAGKPVTVPAASQTQEPPAELLQFFLAGS